jgi:hypothetical protein
MYRQVLIKRNDNGPMTIDSINGGHTGRAGDPSGARRWCEGVHFQMDNILKVHPTREVPAPVPRFRPNSIYALQANYQQQQQQQQRIASNYFSYAMGCVAATLCCGPRPLPPNTFIPPAPPFLPPLDLVGPPRMGV